MNLIAVALLLASTETEVAITNAIDTCNSGAFVEAVRSERLAINKDQIAIFEQVKPLLIKRLELTKLESDAMRAGPLKGVFNAKYNRSIIAAERDSLERLISATLAQQKIIDLMNNSLNLKIESFKLNCMMENINAQN